MRRALIIVDVQNDFCEGGALGVTGGHKVAENIAKYLFARPSSYDLLATSLDWHIEPGKHFDTWPAHCVAGTTGAALHPEIEGSVYFADNHVEIRKGMYGDAYSAFEGVDQKGKDLATILREHKIEAVDIVGIATDYCVKATALSALSEGFEVRVLEDLCAGVAPDTTQTALSEMREAGADLGTLA